MEERDQWEKIIQSKFKDFEVNTHPDDWKEIESRISGKKVVLFRRWYYAAAVITLFLLITGGYYFFNNVDDTPMIAMQIEKAGETNKNYETAFGGSQLRNTNDETGEINNYEYLITNSQNRGVKYENGEAEKTEETIPNTEYRIPNYGIGNTAKIENSLLTHVSGEKREVKHNHIISETILSLKQLLMKNPEDTQSKDFRYIADANPLKTTKESSRRWTIGAGGGSYSIGMNGGEFINAGQYANTPYSISESYNGEWYLGSPVKRDDYFNDLLTNSLRLDSETNSTGISKEGLTHKQPISLGIGVGYALNNRWSLQSGLVYSLLLSEWSTTLEFHEKSKQKLHFIGIPLSISYQIAEWNKLRFYATSGFMAEWNVAGNIKTFYKEDSLEPEKESIRMKKVQWSVNGRVGAIYPVIKFVNAFVEGGANYYFDNKSSIETIRSDKPFHVSLQAGLRFGF